MNNRCSFRKLLGNGKAALLASLEIYNKPRIDYRDECFVILLLNAWELILKALLAKHKQPIFYRKDGDKPRRTYSLDEALKKAEPFLPARFDFPVLRENLDLLSSYRDNAVHFYNEPLFGSVVFALAQTSVVNLNHLLGESFGLDLSNEITWRLLPLGLNPPIDPIEYIAGRNPGGRQSPAVKQFMARIVTAVQVFESKHFDTGQLLSVFQVKLESVKKIRDADVVVGVSGDGDSATAPIVVTKSVDPKVSHPKQTNEIVAAVGVLHGKEFTAEAFQAIAWKYELKTNSRYDLPPKFARFGV